MRRIVTSIRCERMLSGLGIRVNAPAECAGASEEVFDSESALNPTRADALTNGRACDSDASARAALRDVPCAGAGARSVRKNARSQVGNGAVNGVSVRKTSQAEITLPNMELFQKRPQDQRQPVFLRDGCRRLAVHDIYVVDSLHIQHL